MSPLFNDLNARRLVEREIEVEGGFKAVKYEWVTPRPIVSNKPKRHRRKEEMTSITVKAGGSGFKGLEPGIYTARCDLIADLGMQETNFGLKHKVYIRFSVPDETGETEDGEKFQMSIGKKFTASLGKRANLRKALESWRGKPFSEEELGGFELTKLLNAPATLVVGSYVQEGVERPSIENTLKAKGTVGELIRAPVAVGLDSTEAELAEIPEWLRNTILEARGDKAGEAESQNHAAAQAQDEEEYASDDDIPF